MKGHLHLPHPHNQRLQRIQAPTYERLQARLAEDHRKKKKKKTHHIKNNSKIRRTVARKKKGKSNM
ncbi:hypothetical protein HGQ98_32835 [Achromobacter ruhlandii]|uniref:Uncharacterized protein n=1 Tax=Achromobacter ruhlandii TaxID=72557 RepID=A0A848NM61_9BURK|nr:hypothetical protein [Achromobacter ruhlandii]NMU93958.1 hypothetical protein [Achromobacter ruhlandii]